MRTRELGLSLVNNPLDVSPFSDFFDDTTTAFPNPTTSFITTEGAVIISTESAVLLTTE